ncbi:PI-PLC X domain-containing protein [Hibiscus syriacus]|uniref:PI-PLC X domain-containing protein n=1 Tax=Hibiscus syriacus TaxID=106335 RepID=A0A6A2ZNG6_HIBSY|nr:PI-PLC X domain-containing protein [Hibiscus syriacus]
MLPCFTDYLSLCRATAAIGFWIHVPRLQIVVQVFIAGSGNCLALGKSQPFCTRGQAIIPTSVASVGGLPFNKYSWLMTHKSFSVVDATSLQGVQRLTFYNQEDTVTNQLMNGVRGLMLDMYDFNDDIWLCHSFRGQCFNFTTFQPVINTLREVEAFLSRNPSEICQRCQKKGEDWPTVNVMVQANHRLLVFTSVVSKEEEEGIAYQWKYIIENEVNDYMPGDPRVKPGSCPNRKELRPLNSKSASLFLMNYFPTYPVENEACKEHSAPLADMIGTCFKAAGSMLPNFIVVNFYMHEWTKIMWMQYTIAACQAGAPFGSCKNISMPSSSPMTNTAGSFSGSVQFSKSASAVYYPKRFAHAKFLIQGLVYSILPYSVEGQGMLV